MYVLEQIFYGSEFILALVGVDAVRDGHQPNIVLREKLLGQPPDLDVIPAQPG